MRVVVTRPLADAQTLAERLVADGHAAIIAPLLQIEPLSAIDLPNGPLQAIVASSRHAVWALAGLNVATTIKLIPLFVVGTATAAAAQAAGWQTVIDAGGTADALCREILTRCTPGAGTILYVRGADITLDIASLLTAQGFVVADPIVYRARPVEQLPAPLAASLSASIEHERADAIILLSARTARIYARLVANPIFRSSAGNLISYCLSEVVAEALAELQPRLVRVPEKPDLEHILALVNLDAAQFSLELTPR